MKTYEVDFDCKYSISFTVKAKTKAEAKNKAFEKLKKWASKKTNWNVDAEDVSYLEW